MIETLIDAGNDTIGAPSLLQPADHADPYSRDLDSFESDLLNTCEFALDEDGEVIAVHLRRFMSEYS